MDSKEVFVGWLRRFGTILGCSRLTLLAGTVGEFVSAALPWVLLGLGVAFVMADIV